MKVAVVCSNGKVGKLVVAEALAAGFEVTGFARGENKSEAKNFVQKDIFTLTKEDLASFDVVVDAFGAWVENELPNHGKIACPSVRPSFWYKNTSCNCRRSR